MGRGTLPLSLFLPPARHVEWSGTSPMGRGTLPRSLFLPPPRHVEWSGTSPMGRGTLPLLGKSPTPILCTATATLCLCMPSLPHASMVLRWWKWLLLFCRKSEIMLGGLTGF
eukprot:scaffold24831_cov61-Attheya_sp.AAC.1